MTQVIWKIVNNVIGQVQGSDLPLRASFNVKLNEEENRQYWTVFLHTALWDMTTCK